ncbi:MAG: hypothetical protein KAU14_04005, partial [Thermoplasmata archaeon]|nr:hypothetical protein [Thermoplasmata archaeon]
GLALSVLSGMLKGEEKLKTLEEAGYKFSMAGLLFIEHENLDYGVKLLKAAYSTGKERLIWHPLSAGVILAGIGALGNIKGTEELVEELWPNREKIRGRYTGILLNLLKGEVSKEEIKGLLQGEIKIEGEDSLERRFEEYSLSLLRGLSESGDDPARETKKGKT